jgi:hypothetical protein
MNTRYLNSKKNKNILEMDLPAVKSLWFLVFGLLPLILLPVESCLAFDSKPVAPIITCKNQTIVAMIDMKDPLSGCSGIAKLEVNVENLFPCPDANEMRWQKFFDNGIDGTVDRLGSSFFNPSWLNQWITVSRYIDGQVNPIWQQIRDTYPDFTHGDVLYASYIQPTHASGEKVVLPDFKLPYDNVSHQIRWKVSDQCGNEDQCYSTVLVKDTVTPTPYGVHMTTANTYYKNGYYLINAKSYNLGSFDNCSAEEDLYFTFYMVKPLDSLLNEIHYFKPVANGSVRATEDEFTKGQAQKWLPKERTSEMYRTRCIRKIIIVSVWDEVWNTNYFGVEWLNEEGCNYNFEISGEIATPDGKYLKDVEVTLEENLVEKFETTTDKFGNYALFGEPNRDYVVHAAIEDGDYLNGVSTLDVVYVQRHILGLEAFSDPYKWLAADVNNDKNITASDLVEMRKLILGVKYSFTNSNWRFPIKNQAFVIPNLFPYIERYKYEELAGSKVNQDFVAIKIGDVNYTASVDLKSKDVEIRTSKSMEIKVQSGSYKKDDIISVPVTSGSDQNTFGFQLTMNTGNLNLLNVEPGICNVDMSQIGVFPDKGKITMSYASALPVSLSSDDILFTLQFKATDDGKLENTLSVNGDITKAESYDDQYQVGKIALRFNNNQEDISVLYQNEPNPFQIATSISFYLPEGRNVILAIQDILGHEVKQYHISGIKGLNKINVTEQDLGVSGILFYTLKTDNFTSTKKMIKVE